ncbi:hypothetical protein KIN20_028298 [Parelaphostrongylus tenuis]|uniref:Uncharacterized protein n=1 Tax=Parelaphostrongylus tenuis TaxID=148309 RepID=A0AAD5R0S2_PARTN|nr:hypothetical protein KIN20_028298 [Parelaphostrongylus tenuis]
MIPLWGIAAIGAYVSASFCGKSGVPFSVEVLPSGAPLLGCAQPSCVAQPADDFDDSVFNTDLSGQVDGFFRDGDRGRQGYLQTNKLRANCSGDFDQLSCSRKNQWIGGIEYIDHPRQPLLLQCCTFEGLRFSQIVGVTPIRPGEAVTGGEVVRDGRQISFDVIANIQKVVDENDPKIISYEVAVRRMNCLPDPPEIEIAVDDSVEEELLRVLENANNGSTPLGHEGHDHMEKEKDPTSSCDQTNTKKCRNKSRSSERHSKQHDRSESFGAPIYKPSSKNNQYARYTRRFITKPPVVQIDVTTTTTPTPPFLTFPTFPPFTFPTLPPLPQLSIFSGFTPQPIGLNPLPIAPQPLPLPIAPQSLTIAPQPQAFGVPQANLTPLLPPPTYPHLDPFTHYHVHQPSLDPFSMPQLSVDRSQEKSSFYNPFALPTHYQHHLPFTPVQPMLSPFMQPVSQQAVTAETSNVAAEERFGLGEKSELLEPSLPPTQQHLGTLFQPPPFPALSLALQNFQAQG